MAAAGNDAAQRHATDLSVERWKLSTEPRISADQARRTTVAAVPETSNIQELLASNVVGEPGYHLIFMPRIEENLELAADLCTQLSTKFHIPAFFWKDAGWNANGFYGSTTPNDQQFAIFTRFLSKRVISKPPDDEELRALQEPDSIKGSIKGTWHFMGLCSLYIYRAEQSSTHILLCFDLDNGAAAEGHDVRPQFLKEFEDAVELEPSSKDPFLLLNIALTAVVERFDRDSWSFKRPVRDWEQHRVSVKNAEDTKLTRLGLRYTNMHELSRHVLHISESMNVASRNLATIVEDHKSLTAAGTSFSSMDQMSRSMQLSANRLANLQERAQAFVDRLHNEIQLAFNTVAAVDSDTAKETLRLSRNDNKSFADTLAVLTLVFLPGTFVSGFFGMNFFALNIDDQNNNRWFYSTWCWIFFACTIPIMLFCFIIFIVDLPVIDFIRRNISEPVKVKLHIGSERRETPQKKHNQPNDIKGTKQNPEPDVPQQQHLINHGGQNINNTALEKPRLPPNQGLINGADEGPHLAPSSKTGQSSSTASSSQERRQLDIERDAQPSTGAHFAHNHPVPMASAAAAH